MTTQFRLDNYKCLDPGPLIYYRNRYQTPANEFIGRANSVTLPVGPEPGRAFLLLKETDVDSMLEQNATGPHAILISDGERTLRLSDWWLHKVYQITLATGPTEEEKPPGDFDDVALLVELRDARQRCKSSLAVKQYNIRMPAPPATSGKELYYPDTIDTASSAAWTWQKALDDLWALLPDGFSGISTLPYTPDGEPENFHFIGVSAWDAIHVLLHAVCCTTRYNHVTLGYDVVSIRDADFTSSPFNVKDLNKRLVWDAGPRHDLTSTTLPEKFTVFFPRREDMFGSEPDTPAADNFELTPYYSKEIATNTFTFAGETIDGFTGGNLPVWDSKWAIWDHAADNWDNAADLDTRAQEVVENEIEKILHSHKRVWKIFGGVVETIPVGTHEFYWTTEVTWRNYGADEGLVTEFKNSPKDPITETPVTLPVGNRLMTFDFGRNQYPVYPRTDQVVEVYDSAQDPGDPISPTEQSGQYFIPGRVVAFAQNYEDCWILVLNSTSDTSAPNETRYLGRLLGSHSVAGDVRPVYAISPLSHVCPAQASSAFSARSGIIHGSGTADLLRSVSGNLTSWRDDQTVYNTFAQTIALNTYLMVGQDAYGDWWLLSTDCVPAGS